MGVNTTGLLNTQTEVYASYKNDAVTKMRRLQRRTPRQRRKKKMRAV